MIAFGNVPSGAVLPVLFGTYGKTNGESITLTGLAVTDIEIYKGVSVTQRASDAGYTLMDTDGIDVDGITGIHGFSIDTGDNTDAGFYAVGSFFTVVVSAVTVDSQTVNFVAATFRLVAAESVAGVVEVDVTHFGGTAATASGGRPEVNATQFAGQTITAAAGVTLPASVASPTNITAGTITTVTNLTNAPTAGDLTATMKASVNTEVLDVLNTDTFAEPGQEAPPATTTLVKKIGYLYKAFRNKFTQTSTEFALYNDDAATVDQKATVSDNGTTFTRGEIATGP